jgi:hypothetical protein
VTAAAEPVCKVADHAPPGWPHLLPRSALEVGGGAIPPHAGFPSGGKKVNCPYILTSLTTKYGCIYVISLL